VKFAWQGLPCARCGSEQQMRLICTVFGANGRKETWRCPQCAKKEVVEMLDRTPVTTRSRK